MRASDAAPAAPTLYDVTNSPTDTHHGTANTQGLSFGLYDGAIYDGYGYFSVTKGFVPESPRKDYLFMVLSDPSHRTLHESHAPAIVGCTLS